MACMHNLFIRSINSAYNQAPYVTERKDIADLAEFVSIWGKILHKHHEAEEKAAFPEFVRLSGGAWNDESKANLEQHQLFEGRLRHLESWCEDVDAEDFVPELRRRIESVMTVLVPHLRDEIPTLEALSAYSKDEVSAAYANLEKFAQSRAELTVEMPFVLGSHDVNAGPGGFMDKVPFFFPYLSYYWMERSKSHIWRFLPSDSWSRPREPSFGPGK